MKNTGFAVVALIVATALTAWGHHAEPEFDPQKMLKLTGSITKVEWVNPHVNVVFNAKANIGKDQAWSFQLDAPTKLQKMGLDRTVFKIGDAVTVNGMPTATGSHTLFASQVNLAGGQTWDACPTPRPMMSFRRC
jgi:hypothetical protein